MDTTPLPADDARTARLEGEADKRRRIAHEAQELARARASAAAGRVIDSARVKEWIDSIGTDYELPPPCSGR